MSLESTVSVAKVGTNSVRATVPEGIAAFLDLKVGDKLVWKMEFQDNERFAVVTKKKSEKKSSKEDAKFALQQTRKKQEEELY